MRSNNLADKIAYLYNNKIYKKYLFYKNTTNRYNFILFIKKWNRWKGRHRIEISFNQREAFEEKELPKTAGLSENSHPPLKLFTIP